MGLFGFLFGRKRSEDADEGSDTPAATEAGAEAAPAAPGGLPSPAGYDDWDDAEKRDWCKAALEALYDRGLEDARMRVRENDEEIEVRARYRGRPIRLVVDYDRSWLEAQTKFVNRRGAVILYYREDEKPQPPPDPDDPWGTDPTEEQSHFYATHVFVKHYPDWVRPMIATMDALADEERGRLVSLMAGYKPSILFIDAEVATFSVGWPTRFHELAARDGLIPLLDEIVAICEIFGNGSAEVDPFPRVFIRGKPAADAQAVERTVCAYCDTRYVLGEDPRCPSCGAMPKAA
jgi:uncharacterized Zn-finger protein